MSKELIERLRAEWRKPDSKPPEMCEAADHIEQLEAENAALKRLDFRQMREMLRAMQAGELTVSRGIEILEMWNAGNWNDDMLPPVRQDLIEEDAMPVEIIDRLNAQLKEALADAAHWKNNHETEVRRARILKERTDMPIERVDAYEQWGKDQLALKEAQAEIEQWKANSKENKLIAEQMAEPYKREIAASQLREQQLRGALKRIADLRNLGEIDPEVVAFEALAIQSDTTALEALIAKAGEVMRERCATLIDYDYSLKGGKEIRSLPGVTLEDLK